MKIRNCFKYDNKSNRWVVNNINSSQPIDKVELKIGTYNVLKSVDSSFVNFFLQYQKRFTYQIEKLFPEENFDILTLNEVTEVYLVNYLLKSKFIQENYFISHINSENEKGIFNVILSKFPMKVIILHRRTVISIFNTISNKSFAIVSAHLTAFEENVNVRHKQMLQITEKLEDNKSLDEDLKNAVENRNIIILGDLNLHHPNEGRIIYEHGYVDLWLENNLPEDSYTWDPTTNSLINRFLLFDNRRMRLDRIILHEKSNLFKIGQMEIFANKRIKPDSYLFPSDHYGLSLKIEIKSKPSIYEIKNSKCKEYYLEVNLSNSLKHNFRSIKVVILYRIITLTVIILSILYLLNRIYKYLF